MLLILKIVLRIAEVVLGAVVIFAAVAVWMADPLNLRAPKDGKLIGIFYAHREAFEKLHQMAAEDLARGLRFKSHFEGTKISEARRKEYERLLSGIRPRPSMGTDDGGGMVFVFADGGILAIGPGWEKGIEYIPRAYATNGAIYATETKGTNYRQQWQGVDLTNLNNAQALPANLYLRPIESNWFIFYQRTD